MRILARIILPYNFSFAPNSFIDFKFENQKVIIIGQSCEGVRVLSYHTKDFCSLNETKEGREFARVRPKSNDTVAIRTIIINKKSEKYLDGTIDLLKSTLFDIYFSFPDNDFANSETIHNQLKEKVTQILAFFINSYRAITNEADIHNPSDIDLPSLELAYSNEKLNTDSEILSGNYLFLTRMMTWISPQVTGYFKEIMSSDSSKKFKQALNSSESTYYLQLLADAKEQAVIRKNFNISIVLSSTATEVFFIDRLIKECRIRNITRLTIGKGKRESTNNYIDAITKGDIRDVLIGDICKTLINKNIKESAEYHEWYKHAYYLRNQIIHEGLIINQLSIAEKAFQVVFSFINYVDILLVESRS
jgi:hypothetical protein